MGGDGDFGEDIELKHYVTAEEKMESGATKSLEIHVESSYAGLGNASRGTNTITGGTKGEYRNILIGMMIKYNQR